MRFALSRISGVDDCRPILRAAAMISKTANGLTPAVSAKPLADDRDERFMVVLLHNSPGVIAEMAGVSTLLDPFGLVVVPFGPATPQIQSIIRTPPLATARSRRPVQYDLLLVGFLETRTSGLAADCGFPIADQRSRIEDRGSRIVSLDRFSIFDPRPSILDLRFNLTCGIQQIFRQVFRQVFRQIFRPVFARVLAVRIARSNGDLMVVILNNRLDELAAAHDHAQSGSDTIRFGRSDEGAGVIIVCTCSLRR